MLLSKTTTRRSLVLKSTTMRRIGVPYLNYTTMKHLLTLHFRWLAFFSSRAFEGHPQLWKEKDSTSASLLASLMAFSFQTSWHFDWHYIWSSWRPLKPLFWPSSRPSSLAFFSTFLFCLSTSRATFTFFHCDFRKIFFIFPCSIALLMPFSAKDSILEQYHRSD